ncbi:right-handed parallel beta-helix repeat-containing protein [Bradyrhizobium sp. U531]|uniref:right-handed parallel beta-helix repeat-containing protein n=1 Tax=Bradyrhizobium sp. U531 TaxID=3053458 RepID=UPI003F422154
MRRIGFMALAVGLFLPVLASAPAHAQATRTWVSGVGDDVNPCSRTAPCKTFAGAISKTAASGEINCLDSAGFGAVTITKSISIICEGVIGGILSAGTNGVIINALATDEIVLKGLDINGVNTGLNGIRVLSAGAVTVQDCIIQNTSQFGIQINNGAASTIMISRVTVTNNALGGVQLRPSAASALLTGLLENLVAYKNGAGIVIDGNGGSSVNATIRNSNFGNNTGAGVSLATGGAALVAMISKSAIVGNGTGISAGANTFARIGQTEINANSVGISGTVSSFGTNQILGNGSGEAVTLLSPALK